MRKIGKTLFFLLGTASLIFMGGKLINWIDKSTAFQLNDVIVNGNRLLNTAEVMKLIPAHEGQNITRINLEEIQRAVEKHPYIETALVSRKFPSALRIDVVERVPVALLTRDDRLYAVDASGILLPRLRSVALIGLPIITGIDDFPIRTGHRINSDRVMEAVELFNLLRSVDSSLYQNLSEVHYNPEKGFLVYFNDTRFPVYFGFDDFYQKAQKLQAFFRKVKEERRYSRLQYVDLRFQEQVVARFH